MTSTRWPGVYRRGSRYVIRYRAEGKQRTESFRTLDEARRAKATRDQEVALGDYREPTRVTFVGYAREWVEHHQGSGHGLRNRTRDDYRRDIERYVVPHFRDRRLTAVRRPDVKAFVTWLANDAAQAERHRAENAERAKAGRRPLNDPGPLRDRTIARIMAVVSACLAAAHEDELRRDNPAANLKRLLPKRDPLPDPDDLDTETSAKALTRAEIAVVLAVVRPEWRPFFRLIAATGLRVSEALGLCDQHLRLDGPRPAVIVRQALGREKDSGGVERLVLGHPKSDYGAREIPLPAAVVSELRTHLAKRAEPSPDALRTWGRLVFATATGTPHRAENVRRRILKPAVEEADAGWAGFHAFRHAFASMHIDRGTNVVKLSKLMGHHAASFTLDVYSHLMDDGTGDALDLDAELALAPAPEVVLA